MKFQSVEELSSVNSGLVQTDNYKSLKNKSWAEKDLQSYIAKNAKLFTAQTLSDELISLELEKPADGKQLRLSPRGKRIDIYIVAKKHTYIVELKTPTHPAENRAALGQLLNYGRYFSDPKKRLVLLTTLFDVDTAQTIDMYELPIQYIYFDEKRSLTYERSL